MNGHTPPLDTPAANRGRDRRESEMEYQPYFRHVLSRVSESEAQKSAVLSKCPRRFREFAVSTNGGEPNKRGMRSRDHQDGYDVIKRFYKLVPQDRDSIDWWNQQFVDYAQNGLVVIGSTEFGGVIALDVLSKDPEVVYYIDAADEADERGRKRLYWLARNVDEFVERLQETQDVP